MKKITIILAALAMFGLSSCDLLDKTPKDTMAPENYFRNETDLRLFSDEFYLRFLISHHLTSRVIITSTITCLMNSTAVISALSLLQEVAGAGECCVR